MARDQSDAKGFAGASYVCWLIDFVLSTFFYIDCLVTNKGIHRLAFLTLFVFEKGIQQGVTLLCIKPLRVEVITKNIKKL